MSNAASGDTTAKEAHLGALPGQVEGSTLADDEAEEHADVAPVSIPKVSQAIAKDGDRNIKTHGKQSVMCPRRTNVQESNQRGPSMFTPNKYSLDTEKDDDPSQRLAAKNEIRSSRHGKLDPSLELE